MLKIESFPVGTLGCNCSVIYSSESKEAIVIDPGNDAGFLLGKMKQLGVTVKALLHTHAHFDHIGGSNQVRAALHAPILLHKEDLFLYEALPEQGRWFGEDLEAPGPVDRFLEDDERFALSDLRVIHTPGHTPGSCSFYTEAFGSPMLFTGDTLFRRSIGRTDLPGGDLPTIKRAIRERLFVLPEETQCIPGHGPSTFLHEEKRLNPFVGV